MFETFLQNEYFTFCLIVLFSIIVAKGAHFILKKVVKITKTGIDDILLENIAKPASILIIFIGLYLALNSLSRMVPYAGWLDNAFFVALVSLISLMVARILGILTVRLFKVQKQFEKTPKLISKTISTTVYLIAFLIILDHLKIQITPLVATLGVGGLAVGLALQNTLSNFFAGLHLISDKPVQVGDFIELPDASVSGYVDDIGWRSTRIKTLLNTVVSISNSRFAESVIVNYSLPEPEMAVLVECGVAYTSDLKKVEKVTLDAARKVQKTALGAIKNFEPSMRYHTFGESNIYFTVVLRIEKFVDKYLVKHEFIKALKERYDKEGIEISWPVRKLYHEK